MKRPIFFPERSKTYLRTILGISACLFWLQLRADSSYEWIGNDSRFSGRFSISDDDFALGSFTTLTTYHFQFQDSLSPSDNVTLDDPRGLYPGNDVGTLTSDRQHLSHDLNPNNPHASFWVAAWKYQGIEVGLYTYNTGDSLEHFTYANYERGILIDSTGVWSLEIVPEASSAYLIGIGACLALAWRFISRRSKCRIKGDLTPP